MKNFYGSYALNVLFLLSPMSILVYIEPWVEFFKTFQTGTPEYLYFFFFLPISLLFICLIILGYIIEYLCNKACISWAFNFPYEKITFKPVYYLLFYLGLFSVVFPFLVMIVSSILFK